MVPVLSQAILGELQPDEADEKALISQHLNWCYRRQTGELAKNNLWRPSTPCAMQKIGDSKIQVRDHMGSSNEVQVTEAQELVRCGYQCGFEP